MEDHVNRRKRKLPKSPCGGRTLFKPSIILSVLFLLTQLAVPIACMGGVEGCWQSLMLANFDMDKWLDETEFQTFVPLYHEALIVADATNSMKPHDVDNQCLFDPTLATTLTPRLNIILDATFKSLACVCGSQNSNGKECCAVLREEGLLQYASNGSNGSGGVFLDLSGLVSFDPSTPSERSSLTTLTTFCSVISNAIENACPMFIPDIVTTNNPTSSPERLSPTTAPTTSLPTAIGTATTPSPSSKTDATERPSIAHITSSVPTSSTEFPTFEPTAKVLTPAPTNFDVVDIESDEGISNVSAPNIDDMGDEGDDGVDVLGAVGVAIVIAGILMGCLVAPGVIRRLRENKERRAYLHTSLRSSVSERSFVIAPNTQTEYNFNNNHDQIQQQRGRYRRALRKPSLSSPLAEQHDDYIQENRQREVEDEVSSVSAPSSSSSSSSSSAPMQIEFNRNQSKSQKNKGYGKLDSDDGSSDDHRPPSSHYNDKNHGAHPLPGHSIIRKAASPFRRHLSGTNHYDKLENASKSSNDTSSENKQSLFSHYADYHDKNGHPDSTVYDNVDYDDTDDNYGDNHQAQNNRTPARTTRSLNSISESSESTTTTDINDLDDLVTDQESRESRTTNTANENRDNRGSVPSSNTKNTKKNMYSHDKVDVDTHSAVSDPIDMARSFGPMMMFPPTLPQQQPQPPLQQAYHPQMEPPTGYPGPFPPPLPMQPPNGYPLPPMMMPPQLLEEYYRNAGSPYPMPWPPINPYAQNHPRDISIPPSQSRKARIDMAGVVSSSNDAATDATTDETPQHRTNSSRSGTTASELTGSSTTGGQRGVKVPSSTGSIMEVFEDDGSYTPHVASKSSGIAPQEMPDSAPQVGSLPFPPVPPPPPLPAFPYPMLPPFMYMPPPFPPPPQQQQRQQQQQQQDQSHVNDQSAAGNGFLGYPYPVFPPFMYPPAPFLPPNNMDYPTINQMDQSQKRNESTEVRQESHHKQPYHPAMFWPYMYPPPFDSRFSNHHNASRSQPAAENAGKVSAVDAMADTQLPPLPAEHHLQNTGVEGKAVEGVTVTQQQSWAQMYHSIESPMSPSKNDVQHSNVNDHQYMSPPSQMQQNVLMNQMRRGGQYSTDSNESSPANAHGRSPRRRSGSGGRGWATSSSSTGISFHSESESMEGSDRHSGQGRGVSTGASTQSGTGTSTLSPGTTGTLSPYEQSPSLQPPMTTTGLPTVLPVPFQGNENDELQSQDQFSNDQTIDGSDDLYTLPEESASVSMSTDHSRSIDYSRSADLNLPGDFMAVQEEA